MLSSHKSRFVKPQNVNKPPSTKSSEKKPFQCTGSSAAVCMNVTRKTQRSSSSDQTLPDCSCLHVSFSMAIFFLLDCRYGKTLVTTPCPLPGRKYTASYKKKSYTRLQCEDCFHNWLFHGFRCLTWLTLLTCFFCKNKAAFFSFSNIPPYLFYLTWQGQLINLY